MNDKEEILSAAMIKFVEEPLVTRVEDLKNEVSSKESDSLTTESTDKEDPSASSITKASEVRVAYSGEEEHTGAS